VTYRESLAAAVDAVTIHGDAAFSWVGRRRAVPGASREALRLRLRDELYVSFYCSGGVVPAGSGSAGGGPPAEDAALMAEVTSAIAGDGRREDGWAVERVEGEVAVVRSGAVRARADVADCRPAPVAGAVVSLPAPRLLPVFSPGFLTLAGDAGDDAGGDVVRVYWHVSAGGAAPLVSALTAGLNARGVPFRLKVADHRRRFFRCDAAVLYLPAAAFASLREWLAWVAADLRAWSRPEVPALTLALAPGVGLAEEDGRGESFGDRRCGLLAAAIVSAHEEGGGLERVLACFADAGVDVDRPYREPALAGRHVLP
jgi:hypothetical protein